MSGQWKEVVRLHFKGDRYRDHALDLSALKKLGQFQKMVAETAKELWRAANPDRERLPKNFEEKTRLCLRRIENGSATVPLEVYIEETDQTTFLESEAKEVEEAITMAYSVFEASGGNMPLPERFPKTLIGEYSKWCGEIEEWEEVEIETIDKKQIKINAEQAKKLMTFSETTYEDIVKLTGEVLEADVKQKQFQLWIDDKSKVLVNFTEEQESEVTTALKEHKSLRMEVKGRGDFSPMGKILRVKSVDELKIIPVGEIPFDHSAKPIGQILEDIGKEVPMEEWSKLPSDLSGNLDHYIYGTPKR